MRIPLFSHILGSDSVRGIIGRLRNNGTTAEIVTFTIQDANGHRYYVDEYSQEEYYELGKCVEVPVYVKTIKKRIGDIGFSFCVQTQGGSTHGEHY